MAAVPLSFLACPAVTGPGLNAAARRGISSPRGSGAHFARFAANAASSHTAASLCRAPGATSPVHSPYPICSIILARGGRRVKQRLKWSLLPKVRRFQYAVCFTGPDYRAACLETGLEIW